MRSVVELALPVFWIAIALEALASVARRDGRYALRDTLANALVGAGNLVADAGWALVAWAIYSWAHARAPVHVPTHALASWVALFFLDDLAYYWFHRASHRCRILWASHVVHHSSELYNLSTATRQTWTSGLIGWVFWVPLAFAGFHPLMILTAQGLSLVFQFFLHTPYVGALGPLGWVLNTPSHHRAHHGRNPEYLDRNFGGVLIVWDRLFGTFEPERARVDFGITTPLRSSNPLVIALHEYAAIARDVARARSLREAFARVVAPPGWTAGSWPSLGRGTPVRATLAGIATGVLVVVALPLAFASAGERYVEDAIARWLLDGTRPFEVLTEEHGLGPEPVVSHASWDGDALVIERLEPASWRGDVVALAPGRLDLWSPRRNLLVRVRNAPRVEREEYLRALTRWRTEHYRFESRPDERGLRWTAEPLVPGWPRVEALLDGALPLEMEFPGYRSSARRVPARARPTIGASGGETLVEWDLAGPALDVRALDFAPLELDDASLRCEHAVRARPSWPPQACFVHARGPFWVTVAQVAARGFVERGHGLPVHVGPDAGELSFAGDLSFLVLERGKVELSITSNLPWPELLRVADRLRVRH